MQSKLRQNSHPVGKIERLIDRWKGKRYVLVLRVAGCINAD
jgi:hypothetical protein